MYGNPESRLTHKGVWRGTGCLGSFRFVPLFSLRSALFSLRMRKLTITAHGLLSLKPL
jgi:hypothetical protein